MEGGNLFDKHFPSDFLEHVDDVIEESEQLAKVLKFPAKQLALFEVIEIGPPDEAA